MTKLDFCHLHTHTQYSVLDGINRIDQLCKYVKEQGMTSCAITDHGVLHGVLEFYQEAKKAGIKPVIGVEAYITSDEDGKENKDKTRDNHHCIMVAQNEVGLRNIFWLTNQANMHNFYFRPRISIHNLEKRSEGIIATSSCLGGIASKQGQFNARQRTFRDAHGVSRRTLETFATIFHGTFFCEIQDNPEFWQQQAYNTWLVQEARTLGLPLVITADAHYLDRGDKATHNLVMAKQMGCTLEEYDEDEDGLKYGEGHYIRTPEEMLEAAKKYNAEEAFYNTMKIADSVDLDLKLGEYQSPMFDIEQEDDYEDFKQWKETRSSCEMSAISVS